MKTKICSKCKKEKSISEFYRRKVSSDGFQPICKVCAYKSLKDWHLRHQDHTKQYADLYYLCHHNEIKQKHRKFRELNPFKIWAKRCIANHKVRGFDVQISENNLESLARNTFKCFYCHKSLSFINKKIAHDSASLDRIDNDNIMILDSVRIICNQCNTTKHNRTHREFINYCKLIIKNHGEMS